MATSNRVSSAHDLRWTQAHSPYVVIECARRTVYSAGVAAGRTRWQVRHSIRVPSPKATRRRRRPSP